MEEIGYHFMFRLMDDRVIAPSVARRRILAQVIYKVARPYRLLCFGYADTHVHVLALCSGEEISRMVQHLTGVLRKRLAIPLPFQPPRIRRLEDQHHLLNAFHYCLRQPSRHDVKSDLYRDATSLPELLGMRLLPSDSPALVREMLPRLRRRELLSHLGPLELRPRLELDFATDAAAAAIGLPDLRGSSRQVRLASAAIVALAEQRISSVELAGLLGCSRTTIWRLKGIPVPRELLRAVALQLALRVWLREQGKLEPPTSLR